MSEDKLKKARPILGVVTSDKMAKSRVATVERLVKHKRYGKIIRQRTKIMFHDADNSSKTGDSVLIVPASPKSHRKRFDLLKIVEQAKDI